MLSNFTLYRALSSSRMSAGARVLRVKMQMQISVALQGRQRKRNEIKRTAEGE